VHPVAEQLFQVPALGVPPRLHIRILIVGMKHGPQGIREATNKVLALRAGLTRADCWKRLRVLREAGKGSHPAPRNWPAEVKELLREGYQQGGEKKRQAIKTVRDLFLDCQAIPLQDLPAGKDGSRRRPKFSARHLWTDLEEKTLGTGGI